MFTDMMQGYKFGDVILSCYQFLYYQDCSRGSRGKDRLCYKEQLNLVKCKRG